LEKYINVKDYYTSNTHTQTHGKSRTLSLKRKSIVGMSPSLHEDICQLKH
jgi:hypothetical protein